MSSTKVPETLAVFDFDGTITTKDSMLACCRFVAGSSAYVTGMILLAPMLLAMKAGLVSRQRTKEAFLSRFLKGKSREELQSMAEAFTEEILVHLIRPQALSRIQQHKDQGHRLLIVSASLDIWLAPWAASQEIPLLSSQGEFIDGIFSGKLTGENCRGAEKVRRITEYLGADLPDHTIAYGDSSGDTELLQWADKAYFKPFR